MAESWARIEAWLERWAPATFAALAPPAEPSEIRDAERAVGMSFPEPLRESLRRHAGSGYVGLLPPFYWLLGPAELVRAWRISVDILDGDPEAEELADLPDGELPGWWQGPWWHRRWLPFAADGGGGHLVIDQRPHPPGRPGRIGSADKVDGGQFGRHPMWTDLPTLLGRVATAVETGEELNGYEPFVTERGELDWDIL